VPAINALAKRFCRSRRCGFKGYKNLEDSSRRMDSPSYRRSTRSPKGPSPAARCSDGSIGRVPCSNGSPGEEISAREENTFSEINAAIVSRRIEAGFMAARVVQPTSRRAHLSGEKRVSVRALVARRQVATASTKRKGPRGQRRESPTKTIRFGRGVFRVMPVRALKPRSSAAYYRAGAKDGDESC
jgi:hypothetical protein